MISNTQTESLYYYNSMNVVNGGYYNDKVRTVFKKNRITSNNENSPKPIRQINEK